jgi:hypothetical protein
MRSGIAEDAKCAFGSAGAACDAGHRLRVAGWERSRKGATVGLSNQSGRARSGFALVLIYEVCFIASARPALARGNLGPRPATRSQFHVPRPARRQTERSLHRTGWNVLRHLHHEWWSGGTWVLIVALLMADWLASHARERGLR